MIDQRGKVLVKGQKVIFSRDALGPMVEATVEDISALAKPHPGVPGGVHEVVCVVIVRFAAPAMNPAVGGLVVVEQPQPVVVQ